MVPASWQRSNQDIFKEIGNLDQQIDGGKDQMQQTKCNTNTSFAASNDHNAKHCSVDKEQEGARGI